MKKSELRQIIKEEISKILVENEKFINRSSLSSFTLASDKLSCFKINFIDCSWNSEFSTRARSAI